MARNRLTFGFGALLQTLVLMCISSAAQADNFFTRWFEDDPLRQVVVADPFLNMHTGPGVGYPVFHVVGRNETIDIIKRRTDWFLVRTDRGVEGWVGREEMLATLETTGDPAKIRDPSRHDYASRRWEGGAFIGRFDTASEIALFSGYGFTDHLTAELTLANVISAASDSYIASVGLNHTFAPEWWVSPYFGIGTGVISINPRASVISNENTTANRTDQIGYFTLGMRGYVARRLLLRAEYRSNVIFTDRDDNEELHEWKVGFAYFY
jgi:hypothetical protein